MKLFIALALTLAAAAVNAQTITNTTDLHPFSHVAYIPFGSDVSSIKFEGIKLTKVATQRVSTEDTEYCRELQFRDPGGSMFCPAVHDTKNVPAYEITYSYQGQPMASDEYGNTNFTFYVDMNPDELSPALKQQIALGKQLSKAQKAALFTVATSEHPVARVVIDESQSTFCDGNYWDGNWKNTLPSCSDVSAKDALNPKKCCDDVIKYTTAMTRPDYVTVTVDPAL